jgi:hypothetical protein
MRANAGERRAVPRPSQARLPGDRVAPAEAQELAVYVDPQLREKLSRSFELVDAPADDVLRIRFIVVDAEPTNDAQIVMLMPRFATVNTISPKGAFTGSVTLGGEFFEGHATEAGAAFVGYGRRPGIDATVAFRRWHAAKKVIERATEKLARDLEALREPWVRRARPGPRRRRPQPSPSARNRSRRRWTTPSATVCPSSTPSVSIARSRST